jgi:hypothetical protein
MPINYEPSSIQPTQTYLPTLTAATPPTAVTYSKQLGNYRMVGTRLFFDIDLIITSVTKLTGLSDAMRVTLPTTIGSGPTKVTYAQGENSVPVLSASGAELVPGNNYLTLKQTNLGKLLNLTFGLLDGIGVLSNTITIKVSGSYESA